METLNDIFVPYEIAVKLKEIGFDTKCIAYYYDDKELHLFEKGFEITTDEEYDKFFIAPTWEQVLKWFRDKNYIYNIFSTSDLAFFGEVYNGNEFLGGIDFFKTYEQAQEQLIYKLIEVYKNDKK